MSHFVVIVAVSPLALAAAGGSIEQAVTPMLQPYHEFECTGMADQYVVDVDKTEEAREAFDKDTERRFRDPNGVLHDAYDDRFYRDPTPAEIEKHGGGVNKRLMGTGSGGGVSWHSKDWGDGKGYRGKIHQLPEGWEDVKISSSEVVTFAEWAKSYYGVAYLLEGDTPDYENGSDAGGHKYGFIEVRVRKGRPIRLSEEQSTDEYEVVRVVDRTNPNRKWDWWVVGGRWSGYFNRNGSPGDPNAPASMQNLPEDGNSIRLADWKYNERIEAKKERYGRYYDDLHAAMAEHPAPLTWEQMRDKHTNGDAPTDWDAARTEFHNQPAVLAAKEVVAFDATEEDKADEWGRGKIISSFGDSVDDWFGERDDVVFRKAAGTVLPFAYLDSDGWHAKGEMLMFAAVADENENWHRQLIERLDNTDPDTVLVAVDCHI